MDCYDFFLLCCGGSFCNDKVLCLVSTQPDYFIVFQNVTRNRFPWTRPTGKYETVRRILINSFKTGLWVVLLNKSSSSPPHPQYSLLKPFILLNCSSLYTVTEKIFFFHLKVNTIIFSWIEFIYPTIRLLRRKMIRNSFALKIWYLVSERVKRSKFDRQIQWNSLILKRDASTYFRRTDTDRGVDIWICQCTQNNARRFFHH